MRAGFSISAFAEIERSRLTVVSSTPIASAIRVVDQRFSRSMTTNDDLRRARGRGGWLPSQEDPPLPGVPCSPLTGILAEGWGLDQAGLTSENPMFLASLFGVFGGL